MPSELRGRALIFFVLSALLQQPAAVRVGDLSADVSVAQDGIQDSADECVAQLRTIYRSVTFRDLFSPLLDGAYRIRNRFSGEYLAAAKDGHAGTTLYHVVSGEQADWSLKRVKKVAGMPVYTLKNRKSNQYLVAPDAQVKTTKEVGESGHWSLALASDGVHRVIRMPLNGDLALTGESSVLAFAEHSDTEESLEGMKGEWYLEAFPSWWRVPKSDKSGYQDQWKVAGNIPIFPGTDFTWRDLCDTENHPIDCPGAIGGLRQRYKEQGTISETHRRYVTQNLLSSTCEMPWYMMRHVFAGSVEALAEMSKVAGSACAAESVTQVGTDLRQAIEEECLDACLASIRLVLESQSCEKPENATALFEQILSHNTCGQIDTSSLEGLADFAVAEKCLIWHRPSPLWNSELHGRLSLTRTDGNPVCSVPVEKESSRNSRDLVQNAANGVCVAGTTCQCPQDFLQDKDTTMNLMSDMLYIEEGSSAEAVFQDQLFKQARKVALRVVILGSTLTAAVVSIPFSITFIPRQIMAWSGVVVDAFTWRCADTAACWPIDPKQTKTEESRTACRLPDAAKDGGSIVWFMPPPRVQIKRTAWYKIGRRCEFAKCSGSDFFKDNVGFFGEGKKNVKNCQPMVYEQMTAEQQQAYLEKLRETLPVEYAGEI